MAYCISMYKENLVLLIYLLFFLKPTEGECLYLQEIYDANVRFLKYTPFPGLFKNHSSTTNTIYLSTEKL